MDRTTKTYLTTALLALAIIVVSINAALSIRSLQMLDQSQIPVAHTWQVIDTVDQVMGSLNDAESSSRGYLITGEDPYLEPYRQARRDIPVELDALQKLTVDNPHYAPRLTNLRALIDDRLSLLQEGINERAAGSLESVRPLVLTGQGKFDMDHIRSIAWDMKHEEQQLLVERSRATDSAGHRATITAVVASTFDLLLIVYISWSLLREQRLRQASDEATRRLQMLQSISDVALTQLPIAELTAELLRRVRTVVGADATILAMSRAGKTGETSQESHHQLLVEAAEGLDLPAGTVIAPSQRDPLRRAMTQNKILIVNYEHGGAVVSAANGTSVSSGQPFEITFEESRNAAAGTVPLRNLLIIPLSASGTVMGVLVAARYSASAFLFQDEQLLSVVADRIATALDRANAYEAERSARRTAEESAQQVRALNAELEQRVAQRTSELEATNKELEAFSYSVSHDLRAPLRTVDGFSLALQEDYSAALDVAGADFIRRIRDGVQRMGQLIDALLQLSRITRAELTREPVDLSQLATDIAAELQQQNPDRRILFTIQRGLQAEGDPKLLRVGLENLLGNAVKFTGKTDEAHIELGHSVQSGEFFIRDNGAGFDMKYAPKLFTAFQRLHGEKDFKGSGIGLATVARVIRRHHGSIRAEGQVDRGATFWFTLG
ncbi:MAG TPA: CHASE3 domain-containing protein [Acidisarcina sp.]